MLSDKLLLFDDCIGIISIPFVSIIPVSLRYISIVSSPPSSYFWRLVNEDYSDFRIIDVGCLKVGEVKIPSFSQVITGDAANNLGFINTHYLNEIWE